mgnify:CR=1 FL=1
MSKKPYKNSRLLIILLCVSTSTIIFLVKRTSVETELAIFLPPLAVLFAGKPFQAFINLCLCLLIRIPAVIHAILVVRDKKADKRMERQVSMMKGQ